MKSQEFCTIPQEFYAFYLCLSNFMPFSHCYCDSSYSHMRMLKSYLIVHTNAKILWNISETLKYLGGVYKSLGNWWNSMGGELPDSVPPLLSTWITLVFCWKRAFSPLQFIFIFGGKSIAIMEIAPLRFGQPPSLLHCIDFVDFIHATFFKAFFSIFM